MVLPNSTEATRAIVRSRFDCGSIAPEAVVGTAVVTVGAIVGAIVGTTVALGGSDVSTRKTAIKSGTVPSSLLVNRASSYTTFSSSPHNAVIP